MRTPNVTLRTVGFIDRRSEDLHARYAVVEQRRFAHRVARNPRERERLDREWRESLPNFCRSQAD